MLAFGEVTSIFQNDERNALRAEVRNDFVKEYPNSKDHFLKI